MKNRPVELVTASVACAEAIVKRDTFIEAGDKVGVEIMNLACAILDERYNSLYRQWQILGGTSDIDSLVLFCDRVIEDSKAITPNGGSKVINLNGYKATATASWRERHLNEVHNDYNKFLEEKANE